MSQQFLSRRSVLGGTGCLLGCTGLVPARGALARAACTDLLAPPPLRLSPEGQERHSIYLLLTMALVFDAWGVDRTRPELVAAYAAAEPGRRFDDYLGYNIGALLVDRNDAIICFALNRNIQLNSTLEHAEARAVRDGIRIANATRPPGDTASWSFGSLLQADRLYATLEPCAQCSGIMELANLGSMIYAQDDPGQHHISTVLYNLYRQPGMPGPLVPIRATFLSCWGELASAYQRFVADAAPHSRVGLTSFLETVAAYRIYRKTAAVFAAIQPRYASNATTLAGARAFRDRWRGRLAQGIAPD
jgi:tRNA(Arg) A34 adenosine deaminase TadA